MKYRTLLAFTLATTLALSACHDSSPSEPDNGNPEWLNVLIRQISSEPVTNPPTTIWSYSYRGETVYLRSGQCCDIWSELYNRSGILLCHPSGGITGRGDGLCPDFHSTSTDERLIWRDPRS